jgi:hypothetical protein
LIVVLPGHAAGAGAGLGNRAEGEGHAHFAARVADRELFDRFVLAIRGLQDLRGAEVRLREFLHREQIGVPQRVVAFLVPLSSEFISMVTSR